MKKFVLIAVGLAWATGAWAADVVIQAPAKPGDTGTVVRQVLGEPEQVTDSVVGGTVLQYRNRGYTVSLDESGIVTNVTMSAGSSPSDYPTPYGPMSRYAGQITNGVDMSQSLEQAAQGLGTAYEEEPDYYDMGGGSIFYVWTFDNCRVTLEFLGGVMRTAELNAVRRKN